MKNELTAKQEDSMLEQGRERDYERKLKVKVLGVDRIGESK